MKKDLSIWKWMKILHIINIKKDYLIQTQLVKELDAAENTNLNSYSGTLSVVNDLLSNNLVEKVKVGRSTVISLTEKGRRIAVSVGKILEELSED